MSLARAISRPFWTCRACRVRAIRAFTTTSPAELPRRRSYRPRDSLAPYTPDDLGAATGDDASYKPLDSSDLPAFEDEAFADRERNQTRAVEDGRRQRAPSGRSDGISNLSNKSRSIRLSIPSEYVEKEQEEGADDKTLSHVPKTHQFLERQPPQRPEDASDVQIEEEPMSQLPWYLQSAHQHPSSPSSPSTTPFLTTDPTLQERQQLPDLPPHSPLRLQPILHHLSIDIGLDNLTVLDLRKLDPPPALGANLIMLFGTARSEKHLSVSAARFCSWLRREHKMHPYADGLIGPNELKIKQKRKAKKARALANAGAGGVMGGAEAQLEALDDGIKTGWICVHVGWLDPHPEAPMKEVNRPGGVVGFGEEDNKVTIVVQMFTEEKREYVDLENLWANNLRRNLRKQEERAAAPVRASDAETEVEKAIEEENKDEGERLTAKELKARRRFKMGEGTVLEDAVSQQGEARI